MNNNIDVSSAMKAIKNDMKQLSKTVDSDMSYFRESMASQNIRMDITAQNMDKMNVSIIEYQNRLHEINTDLDRTGALALRLIDIMDE